MGRHYTLCMLCATYGNVENRQLAHYSLCYGLNEEVPETAEQDVRPWANIMTTLCRLRDRRMRHTHRVEHEQRRAEQPQPAQHQHQLLRSDQVGERGDGPRRGDG